jgi:hypothetical protein
MWANTQAQFGLETPRMARPTTPEKVAAAVLKAIGGAEELLVAPGPMRPLIAFGQMAPGRRRWMIKRMGVLKVFREGAERRKRTDASAPDAAPASAEKEAEPAAPAAP